LAIELAAARVRAMSPELIASHLTDRFKLLKGGDLTALPRQHTLRATIDWSYDLLSPPERALLHRLSVFAGGFALDAAEAVGADGDATRDVLDLLGHLVDKSLVVFEMQDERYKLLETVRQYALERLDASGEASETRDRHLAFYVALAQRAGPEMNGRKQAAWRTRLDAEHDNILLAFGHARHAPGGGMAGLVIIHGIQQWFGWGHVGLWHEVELQALAHPDAQQENVPRSRALYVAAQATYLSGRYEEADALAQSSVRIARACGDPSTLAESLYRLGITAGALDRQLDAHEHLAESLAFARQANDPLMVAAVSGGLGELYSQQEQFELAEAHYLEALANLPDDRENSAVNLTNLARNAIAVREQDKAAQYLRQAVSAADAQYSSQNTQALLRNCSGVAALRGEWTFALRLSGAADAHREQHALWGNFFDARFYAQGIAPAHEALDNAAAEAAVAEGRAQGPEAALAEAVAWLQSLPAA
jgi:tetratricopeptide (TPR) repeat protein